MKAIEQYFPMVLFDCFPLFAKNVWFSSRIFILGSLERAKQYKKTTTDLTSLSDDIIKTVNYLVM